jgi:adenosine deaminase
VTSDLVARLRDERVPLTVCPLSDVALKGVPRIEEHPLPRMLELGLVTTRAPSPRRS